MDGKRQEWKRRVRGWMDRGREGWMEVVRKGRMERGTGVG